MPAPARTATGKPFYGPYDAQELLQAARGRARHHAWCRSRTWSTSRTRRSTSRRTRSRRARRVLDISGTELRRRLQEGARHPGVVLVPGGGRGAAPHASAAPQAGLHGLLHRPLGLGQVDHRQRAAGQAAGDGRPAGDAARRRPRAQAPVERARLLEGAPRPQHPAHRLRRERDHEERRHRDLRADRALRGDTRKTCAR